MYSCAILAAPKYRSICTNGSGRSDIAAQGSQQAPMPTALSARSHVLIFDIRIRMLTVSGAAVLSPSDRRDRVRTAMPELS
jgi:hypothetical protein